MSFSSSSFFIYNFATSLSISSLTIFAFFFVVLFVNKLVLFIFFFSQIPRYSYL
nr:MAG TPA: hypothetical protein [Caudoviricetes sp.]